MRSSFCSRASLCTCILVSFFVFHFFTLLFFFNSTFVSSICAFILKESSRQRPRSAMSRNTPGEVDGDLDESIKRSASDRLGDLVPQVRAQTSPGVFRDMALLGLCLGFSFSVLYCRTQANLPTLMCFYSHLSFLVFCCSCCCCY